MIIRKPTINAFFGIHIFKIEIWLKITLRQCIISYRSDWLKFLYFDSSYEMWYFHAECYRAHGWNALEHFSLSLYQIIYRDDAYNIVVFSGHFIKITSCKGQHILVLSSLKGTLLTSFDLKYLKYSKVSIYVITMYYMDRYSKSDTFYFWWWNLIF